jgi:hypothetical protein
MSRAFKIELPACMGGTPKTPPFAAGYGVAAYAALSEEGDHPQAGRASQAAPAKRLRIFDKKKDETVPFLGRFLAAGGQAYTQVVHNQR